MQRLVLGRMGVRLAAVNPIPLPAVMHRFPLVSPPLLPLKLGSRLAAVTTK